MLFFFLSLMFCCQNLLMIYLLSFFLKKSICYVKWIDLDWSQVAFLTKQFHPMQIIICRCDSIPLFGSTQYRQWEIGIKQIKHQPRFFCFLSLQLLLLLLLSVQLLLFEKPKNCCFSLLCVFVTTHYGDLWITKNNINSWVEIIVDYSLRGLHHSKIDGI